MSSLSKPVLFLDFDRTLFDTERFYEWLGSDRYAQILALISGRREAPDYARFLFPAAIDFLRAMRPQYRLVLLSYSVNVMLQRRKVRESGAAALCDDVLIVQSDKGLAATEYLSRFAQSAWRHVFVDDEPGNISDMKRAHPDFLVIRIGAQRAGEPEGLGKQTGQSPHLPPDMTVPDLTALRTFLQTENPVSR